MGMCIGLSVPSPLCAGRKDKTIGDPDSRRPPGADSPIVVDKPIYVQTKIVLDRPLLFRGKGKFIIEEGGQLFLGSRILSAPIGDTIFDMRGGAIEFEGNSERGTTVYASWFGVKGDGDGNGSGTDNIKALRILNKFCRANPSIEVRFPPGIICTTSSNWMLGVSDVILDFQGAMLQNIRASINDYQIFPLTINSSIFINVNYETGEEAGRVIPTPIETVRAGSRTVRLIGGRPDNFSAGTPILVCGYDQQGGGFPYNFRRFEWRSVVDVRDNDIILDAALDQEYRSDWFAYDTDKGAVGSAGVLSLRRRQGFDMANRCVVKNMTLLRNPYDLSPEQGIAKINFFRSGRFVVAGVRVFHAHSVNIQELYCGEGGLFSFESAKIVSAEPDKIGDVVAFDRCEMGQINQATGFNEVRIVGSVVTQQCSVFPKRLYISRCRFSGTGIPPIVIGDVIRSTDDIRISDSYFDYDGTDGLLRGGPIMRQGGRCITAPNVVWCKTRLDRRSFSVAFGDGRFRIVADKGTRLWNVARDESLLVSDITFDRLRREFVVSVEDGGVIREGEMYCFHSAKKVAWKDNKGPLVAAFALTRELFPAEEYVNSDDGALPGRFEMRIGKIPRLPTLARVQVRGSVEVMKLDGGPESALGTDEEVVVTLVGEESEVGEVRLGANDWRTSRAMPLEGRNLVCYVQVQLMSSKREVFSGFLNIRGVRVSG
jgi:hypothetical protein